MCVWVFVWTNICPFRLIFLIFNISFIPYFDLFWQTLIRVALQCHCWKWDTEHLLHIHSKISINRPELIIILPIQLICFEMKHIQRKINIASVYDDDGTAFLLLFISRFLFHSFHSLFNTLCSKMENNSKESAFNHTEYLYTLYKLYELLRHLSIFPPLLCLHFYLSTGKIREEFHFSAIMDFLILLCFSTYSMRATFIQYENLSRLIRK